MIVVLSVINTDEAELFPAASFAVAVNVCVLLVAPFVFHEKLYGEVLLLLCATPSTLKLTELTPTLSVAFAPTLIVVPVV